MSYITHSNVSVWSFQKEPKDKQIRAHTPGPGDYNPHLIDSSPKWKLGKETRLKEKRYETTSPGPGTHNVDVSMKPKKLTFAGKLKTPENKTPGPGDYNPNKSFTNLSFSMHPRIEQKRSVTPGPGDYNINKEKEVAKAKTPFNSGSKKLVVFEPGKDLKPGPGKYDIKVLSSPKFTFTGKRRSVDHKIKPGPGDYDIQKNVNGPKFTMGSRLKEKINNIPGPGAYNAKLNKSSSVVAMKGKKDTNPVNKSMEEIPGPGHYDTLNRTSSAKVLKWDKQISREKLQKKDSRQNLGPGVYPAKPNFGEGPKFTFHPRVLELKKLDVPGPGKYQSKIDLVKDRNPQWKLTKTARDTSDALINKKNLIIPGPGKYDKLSIENKNTQKFSKLEKNKFTVNNVPGPGAYNPPKAIGAKGIKL